jgi:GGDEF domain-containing protein
MPTPSRCSTGKRRADGAPVSGDSNRPAHQFRTDPLERRQAETILERVRDEPVRVDGRERVISATIGVATSIAGSGEDLFEAADRALYAGKRAGRGQVRGVET